MNIIYRASYIDGSIYHFKVYQNKALFVHNFDQGGSEIAAISEFTGSTVEKSIEYKNSVPSDEQTFNFALNHALKIVGDHYLTCQVSV